jgi:hypothetical protein
LARLNRGDTTKLSIKLSAEAKRKIEFASKNLNLSKAGVIMFALTYILKNPPSKTDLLNYENQIVLEKGNFPITIKKEFSKTIDALQQKYDMNKNVFVGLMVSHHFENVVREGCTEALDERDPEETKPQKVMIQLNTDIKKKMMEFSDKNYISLSGLISFSILEGPYEYFPTYESNEEESFYTTIPTYLYNRAKTGANYRGIPVHFYIELCVHQAYFSKQGIFDL